ncbi:HDIG domain-containing protein, partial [Patescibacteria group bacterium]|nr:HDIG domain-containing protein [Patescibacteria group bacterium]
LKILASQYPAEGINLLDESGLLQYILPEILQGKKVEQGGHHTTDVWTHSIDALKECPSSDPIVRLATLLHDVAKPQTFEIRDNKITFYNHEIVGSRMADKIAKRFKLSNAKRKHLFTLVRFHMFYYQTYHTNSAIRRFMRKVGLENVDDILDLREADRLGSGARKTSWRLEEMKARMIGQLNQPMEVTDLAINGNDLMKEFILKPGAWIGEILGKLLEKVLDEPELNQKEKLIQLSKELIKQN